MQQLVCNNYELKWHDLILKFQISIKFQSRNKHISKKTPCFPRKRSKNKAKPNEFERHILKLSCSTCRQSKMLMCI